MSLRPVAVLYCLVSLPMVQLAAATEPSPAATKQVEFFERSIRPLLIERCFDCHNEDVQESNLRLDSLQAMIEGGQRGPAITPGSSKTSLLIHAVNHSEAELQMPEGEKLTAQEIRDLARWIDGGAVWPGQTYRATEESPAVRGDGPLFSDEEKNFWAFVPPQLSVPPTVAQTPWVQSDVDRFVLARLEQAGLTPAAATDKRTLIRRAYFDLIGLPPRPDQVAAFLADDSPHAFEKVIDRLLATPQYGERWGRHWLDVARYADSNGLDENVAFEFIYKYRDWVIDAFNRDLPYPEFVTYQLAGDLIPRRDDEPMEEYIDRVKAAGFLSVGPKMVADDDPMKKKMDVIDEQLNTISQAFMGLTVGCARCHDHKFDPIPTWDYYALAGILKSTKTLEHLRVVAPIGLHQLKPSGYDQQMTAYQEEYELLAGQRTAVLKEAAEPHLAQARSQVAAYLAAVSHYGVFHRPHQEGDVIWEAESPHRGPLETKKVGGTTVIHGRSYPEYAIEIPHTGSYDLHLRLATSKPQKVKILLDDQPISQRGGYFATGGESESDLRWMRHARLQLSEGVHRLQIERPRISIDQLALTPAAEEIPYEVHPPAEWAQQVQLDATLLQQWGDFLFQLPTDDLGVFSPLFGTTDPRRRRLELAASFLRAEQELDNDALADYREVLFSVTGPLRLPPDAERWLTPKQRARWQTLTDELQSLEAKKPQLETVMAPTDGSPENLPVSIRGNYLTPGEPTQRQFLRIIDGEDALPIQTQQSGRLELARWLTSEYHPLTARVIVNRIWRWRFGRGIVSTPDNFGRLGARPTHPGLLDWLAVKFMTEDQWSLKKLHKRMMLTSTYQMSSHHHAEAAAVDPANTLWWRFPRKRLEAEAIRDAILALGEGLSLQMGGSLMPLKDREYVTGTASKTQRYDNPRRSVYQPIYRSAVYDVLTAFDFPDPATLNGDRPNSVVAPQALLMMNSPLVAEHALRLAEQLLAEFATDDERITWMYEKAVARPPSLGERESILDYLRQQQLAHEHDAHQQPLQIWQRVCRAMISSNEFLYVD